MSRENIVILKIIFAMVITVTICQLCLHSELFSITLKKSLDNDFHLLYKGIIKRIINHNKGEMKMNRFEIDANISKALTKAAKFGFIDVADIFSAGTEFDGNFRLVAEWLMGVLYAIRRSSNPDERKEVQGHIDDFYKSIQ